MANIASNSASTKKLKQVSFHSLDYVLVVAGTGLMFTLLVSVSFLNNGLRVTPFILVTTAAAMFGSFGSGIFAIILGSTTVDYMTQPIGFDQTTNTVLKTLEFAAICIVIFLLSWRSRKLHASNIALRAMTNTLQDITFDLKADARGNKKQLKKLNQVNKNLLSLVNNFIEDDAYWDRKMLHRNSDDTRRIVHASKQVNR